MLPARTRMNRRPRATAPKPERMIAAPAALRTREFSRSARSENSARARRPFVAGTWHVS